MSENKKEGWPVSWDLLPHPIRRIGGAVLGFFQLHQLSSHGDHFMRDPLATPLPGEVGAVPTVPSWPLESDGMEPVNQMYDTGWDDMGRYLE